MAVDLMGLSIPELRRWRAGLLTLDHRQMNEPVDAINDMNRGVPPPQQVMEKVGGTPAVSGLSAQYFKLHGFGASFPDYLVCRTWDGETETLGATDVLVAKPPLLRRSMFDGTVYNGIEYGYTSAVQRIATAGGLDELQRIIPEYVLGDLIYAVRGIIGGDPVIVDNVRLVWEEPPTARAFTAEAVIDG